MNLQSIVQELDTFQTHPLNDEYVQLTGTRILHTGTPYNRTFDKVIYQKGYFSSICFTGTLPLHKDGIDLELIIAICSPFFSKKKPTLNRLTNLLKGHKTVYDPNLQSETEKPLNVPIIREQNDLQQTILMILPNTQQIFLSISNCDKRGIYSPFTALIDHHFRGIGNSGKKVSDYIACFELMNDTRFPSCLNNFRRIESSIIQNDLKLEIKQSAFLLNERRHKQFIRTLTQFMNNLYGERVFYTKSVHPRDQDWKMERLIWCTPLHDVHLEIFHSMVGSRIDEDHHKLKRYKVSFVPRVSNKGKGKDWYYEKLALYNIE
jgi:hypothetical protein